MAVRRSGDARADASGRVLAESLASLGMIETGLHEHDGDAWFVERLVPVRTVMIVGATEIAAALGALVRPLGWRTVLLDPATLTTLYPTHAAFVAKFTAAADALERDGYWLKAEANEARQAAQQSHVGGR